MRDRDLDLIAALVEGRLEDETEARALIASGAEFENEYQAQKLAYETLSSLGPATLSDTERASLHRDVWTELRAGGRTTLTKARAPWYYRWAPVAAGMFVVVGLVAVLNQGGSGDDAGAEAFNATTVADSTEGADGGEAAEPEPAAEDGAVSVTDLLSGDFSRALSESDIAFYAAEADAVRSGELEDAQTQSVDEEAQEGSRLQACLESAGLQGFRVIGASTGTDDDEDAAGAPPEDAVPYLVAVPEEADVANAPIAFVDLFSCELIHVDQ